mmetsp:Transcript_93087/g.207977  ORF Transcript_93087/g.207977 Transcript_93087/m.207977 type:complete len:247 (-) Transcript_93087:52-792(-)
MPGASRPAVGGASGRWLPNAAPLKDQIDDSTGFSGFADRLKGLMGAAEEKASLYGTEEETQGLLGMAQKGLEGVATRAGGALGGKLGGYVQAVSIGRERWAAFFALLCLGALLVMASLSMLPLLVLAPQKFAAVFTSGSLCLLAAPAALKGVGSLVSHLTSREKLPLSVGYVGSMAGTLWASLWYRSTLLTIAFSAMQIMELLWFFASYIPGGSTVLGFVCDAASGLTRRMCCGCICGSGGGSIPL